MDEKWHLRSEQCLEAAESLLEGGFPAQAIEMAWLSMSCAIRGLLVEAGMGNANDESLASLYEREVLPRLRISPENRRAYNIINQLRERVFRHGMEEGDVLTARACLNDARDFLRELGQASLPAELPTPGESKRCFSRDPFKVEPAPPSVTMEGDLSLAELAEFLLRLVEGEH